MEGVAESLPQITISFILSGILVGGLFGYILQKGRFCMNSAFRDTIFIKDFTLFHAYLVALVVTLIGANLLADQGFIHMKAQSFFPLANIVGGYIFGLGIVLAGGCGSGIIYRVGEGQMASWVAVFGFFFGIGATRQGVLKPLYDLLRSYKIGDEPITLHGLAGGAPMVKWGIIAAISIVCIFFALKSKPFAIRKSKGFYWSVTALLVGVTAVLAFWVSEIMGSPGFARGLNFTTPTSELFFTFLTGDAGSTVFPKFALGESIKTTWGIFFIIGVPLGSFISAKILKEFSWKTPRDAKELLTVLGGSFMMGFGAACAGGCNIGQVLTGAVTLSVGSIAATIAIILGNWTMVYFKFIKPMQDME